MVIVKLLAKETKKQNLAQDPSVKYGIEQMLGMRLLDSTIVQPTMNREISSEEIEAYFDDHRAEFEQPSQVRRQISSLLHQPESLLRSGGKSRKGPKKYCLMRSRLKRRGLVFPDSYSSFQTSIPPTLLEIPATSMKQAAHRGLIPKWRSSPLHSRRKERCLTVLLPPRMGFMWSCSSAGVKRRKQ